MIEKVCDVVRGHLREGRITAFLGLREVNGHVGPFLFKDQEDLSGFSLGDRERPGDARYPLNKILIRYARAYPEACFGVLVRGCDERGLKTLYLWNQLDPNRVVPVGIACPGVLAEACECQKPYPEALVAGEKGEGARGLSVQKVDAMGVPERFSFWMEAFYRCIKCYGCRDICPMCFCKECSLQEDVLVKTGELPPEIPLFHLVRAVHMAGRCIDCGLCNEACPANIPLRTLYKKVADIVDGEFHYRPGFTEDAKSPLNMLSRPEEAAH